MRLQIISNYILYKYIILLYINITILLRLLEVLIVTNSHVTKLHFESTKSVRCQLFQGKTLFVRLFVRTNVYSHSDWRKDVYNGRI